MKHLKAFFIGLVFIIVGLGVALGINLAFLALPGPFPIVAYAIVGTIALWLIGYNFLSIKR